MYPGVECAASRKTTSATQPSWVGEETGAGIVEGGVAKGVKVRFRLLRFQFVMRGGKREREREKGLRADILTIKNLRRLRRKWLK